MKNATTTFSESDCVALMALFGILARGSYDRETHRPYSPELLKLVERFGGFYVWHGMKCKESKEERRDDENESHPVWKIRFWKTYSFFVQFAKVMQPLRIDVVLQGRTAQENIDFGRGPDWYVEKVAFCPTDSQRLFFDGRPTEYKLSHYE